MTGGRHPVLCFLLLPGIGACGPMLRFAAKEIRENKKAGKNARGRLRYAGIPTGMPGELSETPRFGTAPPFFCTGVRSDGLSRISGNSFSGHFG